LKAEHTINITIKAHNSAHVNCKFLNVKYCKRSRT